MDTAILDRVVDKGKTLIRLANAKGIARTSIGSVGDAESDLTMLMAAGRGFLVNNSSIELKRKGRLYGVSVVGGLPSRFIGGGKCGKCEKVLKNLDGKRDLFWRLLKIADMPPLARWLRVFDKNILEIFPE